MTFFSWSDDYLVGVEKLDNQHRAIFDAINEFYNEIQALRVSGAAERALTVLLDYSEKHFVDEEEYMKREGYPELDAHRLEHQEFRDQIAKLIDDASRDKPFSVALLRFFKTWIVEHILETDMKYAPVAQKTE
ncbi:bacteriohemerythrin [bacterium]|nr:bacteriohemerythrin [bacterium]MBU1024595.1 bacteriohemerythrin [bacterium]